MDTDSVRIAVLIDADNTSAKYAEGLLEELAAYGTPTVKRAYGDFSSPRLAGWKKVLHVRAIQPMQQFAYTTGKNSTDSALIIDAMDLLYSGNVEAFAIVSSDSDFTSLATRLRVSGRKVYGLGRADTPESLQSACDKFIHLELLGKDDQDERDEESTEQEEMNSPPRINLESALTRAVNACAHDDGWASLSAMGTHLSRTHTAFDPRSHGHPRLGELIAAQPYLETRSDEGRVWVRLKRARTARQAAPKKRAPRKSSTKANPQDGTPDGTQAQD